MAQRTVIRLVDDLDDTEIGQDGGQTVNFALDGRQYEIDLTNDHASEMRATLDRYVRAARKVGGRQNRVRATATGAKAAAPVDYSPQAVRAWAKAKKIDVSPRGRIPQSVVDQFRAAGN
ncbi:Lsr2 family protein [Geodermatophilus sp. SYSU D00814]